MGSQQFCLRWNNHQTNLLTVFDKLLLKEAFVDVTIACEGANIKAHKMILSACSPFFEDIFSENPCKHPIVIMKDMKFCDLKAIVEFMYKGEVNVSQDKLSGLLKTAEALKIKGLTEMLGDQSFNMSDLDHHKSFPLNSRTYSSSPISSPAPINRQGVKKRRRKNSGDINKTPIPNKSPSPESIEESSKSPLIASNKDDTLQSDSSVQGMHKENNEALIDRNVAIENSSEGNQQMLDPSSFMQQSLTENQTYENVRKVYKDKDRAPPKGGDDHSGVNSNSSLLSSTPATDKLLNIKVVKQEKIDKDYYVEDITHILPQSKQDLMVRGVTMVPMTNQSNSTPVTIEEMDYSGGSPSQDSDSMIAIGSDAYSNVSGVTQTADILPQSVSGAIVLGENYEGIAGTSAEQASPGRSSGTETEEAISLEILRLLRTATGSTCPLCSQTFYDRSNLSKHLKYVHYGSHYSSRYCCPVCKKRFKRKEHFKSHLRLCRLPLQQLRY